MYGSAYRCLGGQGECYFKSEHLLYYKLSLDNIYNVLDISPLIIDFIIIG